ncbi:MAG TPA: hypothetical protein VK433_10720 [Stellaceae bacterium]|nr:hypothetical protein [Stellaceae bacterium]
MTAYVEECRQEWKRLGVPDLLAEEMAIELESDLAEARADGVSAAELLGESDPRRFAAAWARERGLVAEPQPPKKKRRIWIWVVAVLAFFVLMLMWLALQTVGASTVSVSPPTQPTPVRSVVIPNFVGMKACHARRIAVESLLRIRPFPRSRCDAIVVAQRPPPHTLIAGRRARHTVVKLRLRG